MRCGWLVKTEGAGKADRKVGLFDEPANGTRSPACTLNPSSVGEHPWLDRKG